MNYDHTEVKIAFKAGAAIEVLTEDFGSAGETGNSWKRCPEPWWTPTAQYRTQPSPRKQTVTSTVIRDEDILVMKREPKQRPTTYIDMTPTWGEVGNLIWRMADSSEVNALRHLKPEFAKAFAMAAALQGLELTDAQREKFKEVYKVEMAKQGFPQ